MWKNTGVATVFPPTIVGKLLLQRNFRRRKLCTQKYNLLHNFNCVDRKGNESVFGEKEARRWCECGGNYVVLLE